MKKVSFSDTVIIKEFNSDEPILKQNKLFNSNLNFYIFICFIFIVIFSILA
jgi:hypothetical protein